MHHWQWLASPSQMTPAMLVFIVQYFVCYIIVYYSLLYTDINCDMNSDGDCKLPMTDEEIDMVGEPLYDCFIPTADAQDERHSSDINNDVSTSQ